MCVFFWGGWWCLSWMYVCCNVFCWDFWLGGLDWIHCWMNYFQDLENLINKTLPVKPGSLYTFKGCWDVPSFWNLCWTYTKTNHEGFFCDGSTVYLQGMHLFKALFFDVQRNWWRICFYRETATWSKTFRGGSYLQQDPQEFVTIAAQNLGRFPVFL